jgi:molybdopterin molybdotransferase
MTATPWEALARRCAALGAPVTGVEQVSTRGAAGRILARDVAAARPLPLASHAVMDGFALGGPAPGVFTLVAGRPERLGPADACPVRSGQVVPPGTACVVLADKAAVDGAQVTVPGAQGKDNIRRMGEEALAGAAILRTGTRLDARHAALAVAAGVAILPVRRRPRIALLALHEGAESLPHIGVLAAMLASPALLSTEAGAVRGAHLPQALGRLAKSHDLVVAVGESLGDESGELVSAIAALGGQPQVLRAALKPAKPIIAGNLAGAAVLGLSGTAYAATVAAHLFLRPLLRVLAGLALDAPWRPAECGFSRTRDGGPAGAFRTEALPVCAAYVDDRLTLSPAGRFGQLGALAAMDGFALVEPDAGDMKSGARCLYHPLLTPLL